MPSNILHIDMDAFFASVEERDDPSLRGKPVVIGSDPQNGNGRGVVSTANYAARKFGIHSAMPISIAWKKNPHAVFIRPNMHKYSEASESIISVIEQYSPLIEKVSIDEAFVDVSGQEKLFGSSLEIARKIKKEIKEHTGLTASIGIASNKFIAKIASDQNKPDGLTFVEEGFEKEFISELDIEKMWGVGKKVSLLLRSKGINKIKHISEAGESRMIELLKSQGSQLYRLSLGIDDRSVSMPSKRKSISEEHTFSEDQNDDEYILHSLLKTADIISKRMRMENIKGRTISIKIRLSGFQTYTRNITLQNYISSSSALFEKAADLYKKFNRNYRAVRLIGISVTNLNINQNETQYDLFTFDVKDSKSKDELEQVVDDINSKYGKKIKRAVFMHTGNKNDSGVWEK